jgi:hypothetical protein
MNTVVVYTSDSTQEVYLKRALLEEYQIPSFITDENFNAWFPHLSNAIGGVKLQVPESYAKSNRNNQTTYSHRSMP